MGDHLDKIPCAVLLGKSGWHSGHQSRLPLLLQMLLSGLSFSRSQPDFEGFFRALRFPPSSTLSPSLFQFDRMQDLPENHFRVSGASWVNIIKKKLSRIIRETVSYSVQIIESEISQILAKFLHF